MRSHFHPAEASTLARFSPSGAVVARDVVITEVMAPFQGHCAQHFCSLHFNPASGLWGDAPARAPLAPQRRLVSVRSPAHEPRLVRVLRNVYQRCLSHRDQAFAWSWTSLSRVPFRLDDPSPTEIRLAPPSRYGGVLPCSGCSSLAETSSVLPSALQMSRFCSDCLHLPKPVLAAVASGDAPPASVHATPTEAAIAFPSCVWNRLEPLLSTTEAASCVCPSRVACSRCTSLPEGRAALLVQTVADSPSALPAFAASASDSSTYVTLNPPPAPLDVAASSNHQARFPTDPLRRLRPPARS